MQINSIQRTENVETKSSNGKRGAKESTSGAESAFAALFAQTQTPDRSVQARAALQEGDQREDAVEGTTATSERKALGTEEPVRSGSSSETHSSEAAGESSDNGKPSAASERTHSNKSSAHYRVAKIGHPKAGESETQESSSATEGPIVATPSAPASRVSALSNTVDEPVTANASAQTITGTTAQASAAVAAASDETPDVIVPEAADAVDATAEQAKPKQKPDFIVESVTVEPPAETVVPQAAKATEEGGVAADGASKQTAKPPVPKPSVNPMTKAQDATQAESTAMYNVPSNTGTDDPSGLDSTASELDAATVDGGSNVKAEAIKVEPHVVRHITESVSSDGSIQVSQTTETKAASTSSQPEVVVERVSVQALPEQALRSVRYLISSGDHTMRMRLTPESLGEVRLEVTSSKDGVEVKLASANPAVREILQTHSAGLRDTLSQDNTQTVRVTVTQDMSSSSWQSSNGGRQGAAQQGAAQRQVAGSQYEPAKQHAAAGTPRREARHNGQLNLYV